MQILLTEQEYNDLIAIRHSSNYILEDLQSNKGMEKLSDLTGLPMGVIVSAFENIFKGYEKFERRRLDRSES